MHAVSGVLSLAGDPGQQRGQEVVAPAAVDLARAGEEVLPGWEVQLRGHASAHPLVVGATDGLTEVVCCLRSGCSPQPLRWGLGGGHENSSNPVAMDSANHTDSCRMAMATATEVPATRVAGTAARPLTGRPPAFRPPARRG